MGRVVAFLMVLMIAAKAITTFQMHREVAFGRQYENEALHAELKTAEESAVTSLTTSVQGSNSDSQIAVPAPLPTAQVCGGTNCHFNGYATFAMNGQPTASLASGQPGNTGNDTSNNLQRNSLIKENNGAVQITVFVRPTGGGREVSLCEWMTFHTQNQDPNVSPTGRSSCGANVSVSLERDTGGCDANSESTCDPTGATQVAPTSTLTQTASQCVQYCTGATPPPSQDNYVNNQWQNSDQSTGWSTH